MYVVDDKDSVRQLHDAPQSDTGAPLPRVLADDSSLLPAYVCAGFVPGNSDDPKSRADSLPAMPIAVIEFARPRVHMFGPPNDETFHGDALYSRGLEHYSISEVIDSSWVRRLERMNSVHPHHHPRMFAICRHLIFAFHDRTFECIADGFAVHRLRCSLSEAVKRMTTTMLETVH